MIPYLGSRIKVVGLELSMNKKQQSVNVSQEREMFGIFMVQVI